MLILFDHGAPRGVSHALRPHTVVTAKARGWERLSNGALLKVAEEAGFDLLFTTDGNLRYQQNLEGPKDCHRRFDGNHQMVARAAAS